MFKRAPKFKNNLCDNCNKHQFVRQVGCGKHYNCLNCFDESVCGNCLVNVCKYGSIERNIVTLKFQSDFDLFRPFRKRQNFAKGECSKCKSKQTQYLIFKNFEGICALCESKSKI